MPAEPPPLGVRPADVVHHAGSVEDVAGRVDEARSAAATVHLGRDAYGVLCQLLPTMLDPVQRATVDALRDQVDALQRAADDLRTTARGYSSADGDSAAEFTP